MMSTGSTGSLFNMGSFGGAAAERVRAEAFAMPIHGPVFGWSPGCWLLDRAPRRRSPTGRPYVSLIFLLEELNRPEAA